MPRINMEDIAKIASKVNTEFSKYKAMLMVCTGTGCLSADGFNILNKFNEILKSVTSVLKILRLVANCKFTS